MFGTLYFKLVGTSSCAVKDLEHDLFPISLNSCRLEPCFVQSPSEWSYLEAGFLPLFPVLFAATSLLYLVAYYVVN